MKKIEKIDEIHPVTNGVDPVLHKINEIIESLNALQEEDTEAKRMVEEVREIIREWREEKEAGDTDVPKRLCDCVCHDAVRPRIGKITVYGCRHCVSTETPEKEESLLGNREKAFWKPEQGQVFFHPDILSLKGYSEDQWDGLYEYEKVACDNGLVFHTKDQAQEASRVAREAIVAWRKEKGI